MLQAHIYEMMIEPLNRTRTVTVYLPKAYNKLKAYPLLIMHDGQNLAQFRAGSENKWGIDNFQKEHEECIVVGIDCNSSHRLNEYAPYRIEDRGKQLLKDYPLEVELKNEGALYCQWIVESLLPTIQSNYSTTSSIGIAGSSMGGIISLYALYHYPQVFSFSAVISPAYWFSVEAFLQLIRTHSLSNHLIYTTVGTAEGGIGQRQDYLDCFNRINEALLENKADVIQEIIKDGIHNESDWEKLVEPMMNAFISHSA